MSFQLSNDQLNAIDGICNELVYKVAPNTHAIAVLTGPAGTGKTTVVTEIINQLKKNAPTTPIGLCATTHRAATVLEDIVGQTVVTGHALFKLRPNITRNGREVLQSTGQCDILNNSVVIIDEASMIGNQFLKAIVDIVKDRSLRLLFIGDPFQLPPPVDKCSIFDGSLKTFRLTKVHRQVGDNPILDKATEFRHFIEKTGPEPVLENYVNNKNEGIHILPHSEFVTKFVEKYIDYTTGAEVDVPLCTYTNDSAINYNNMIRKAAYFLENTIEPFYRGERLIANSAVIQDDHTIMTNNEIVHVSSYLEGNHHDIPGYYVKVDGEYNRYQGSSTKTVFCPKSKAIATKVLNELKAIAVQNKTKEDWRSFYALKNSLADLRPPFAGTTHKAQGGTFPAVFIDKLNIDKCRNPVTRAQLFYVALTRATTNVYINS